MKAKFIRMVIGNKVDSWLASIEDAELRDLVSKNVIVSGGCITSMLLGEPVNDYDVYLRTKECASKLARYYVEKFKANPPTRFKKDPDSLVSISVKDDGPDGRVKIVVKSAGIAGEQGSNDYQYFEQGGVDPSAAAQFVEDAVSAEAAESEDKPKYRPVFLSANCITLSDRVQVVFRFFGEPAEIHSTYDFVHCTNYWDSKNRQLVLKQDALEAILAKDLKYLGQSRYPICAMIRTRKFIKRGWNINAGQYLKIAWDIAKLDLNSITVLEDQLVGVDTAYFTQLIDMLRERDKDRVDSNYLMEIIDKIF